MILCKHNGHDAIGIVGKSDWSLPIPDFPNIPDDELKDYMYGLNLSNKEMWAARAKAFCNCGNIQPGKELYAEPHDHTAIIVGAGPSLKEHINDLHEMESWGTHQTFGINRACNVYPCMYNVSLDPVCTKDYHSTDEREDGYTRVLIMNTITNPEIVLQYHPEARFMFNTNTSLIYSIEAHKHDYGFLFSHTNSIQATLHLVYRMGYRNVEFVGTEFCTYPGEPFYADGNADISKEPIPITVMIDGEEVETTLAMLRHARNIACSAYWLSEAGVKFTKPWGVLGHYMTMTENLSG